MEKLPVAVRILLVCAICLGSIWVIVQLVKWLLR